MAFGSGVLIAALAFSLIEESFKAIHIVLELSLFHRVKFRVFLQKRIDVLMT